MIRTRGIGMIIINFEKIQFDLKLAPDSSASDGKFEVVVLKTENPYALLPALGSLIVERFGFGRSDISKEVEVFRGSEIEVSNWPPLKLQFDGETLQKASFFKVKALPGAVHFVYAKSKSNTSDSP